MRAVKNADRHLSVFMKSEGMSELRGKNSVAMEAGSVR